MRFRKLRIAWSAAWGVVAVLLLCVVGAKLLAGRWCRPRCGKCRAILRSGQYIRVKERLDLAAITLPNEPEFRCGGK